MQKIYRKKTGKNMPNYTVSLNQTVTKKINYTDGI